jgi:hypothetical protein
MGMTTSNKNRVSGTRKKSGFFQDEGEGFGYGVSGRQFIGILPGLKPVKIDYVPTRFTTRPLEHLQAFTLDIFDNYALPIETIYIFNNVFFEAIC